MIKLLKKRYLAFRITSKETKARYEILNLILTQLHVLNRNQKNQVRLHLLEYRRSIGVGILRCDHKSVDKIRFLLNFITTNNKEQLEFHIIGVSGTLKSLRRKFLTRFHYEK